MGNIVLSRNKSRAFRAVLGASLSLCCVPLVHAAPGTVTTGSTTWGAGGGYLFEINDAAGVAGSIADGLAKAREAVASGAARAKLEQFVQVTQQLGGA